MALAATSRLGSYEVIAPLGAGGMGEVYRARDTKLGRDVAVKVIPERLAQKPDALARFEREARSVAALSHPNILAIHDFGTADGVTFAVTELLDGQSLRERLRSGPIPPRKVVEYAAQIAHGLAAAHDKGIVHRDLKPDNLFITREGRVKILDFGLAKQVADSALAADSNLPTADPQTDAGAVLGTVGYMAPEQVRAQRADHRADIFAFGAVLYEMLSGTRAFKGDTAADTMTAILTKDPPELSGTRQDVPPALERIIRHCLEKSPDERFQSAHDLAFDLSALSLTSGTTTPLEAPGRPKSRRVLLAVLGLVVVGAAFLAGLRLGSRRSATTPPVEPRFHRLTFTSSMVSAARFSPGGDTVLYAASSGGRPVQLYLTRPESPESRPLGLESTDLLAVSSAGEMAVLMDRRFVTGWLYAGTLARVPIAGGAPRPLLENVFYADWAPDGQSLAIVREVEGKSRLEFPIGKALHATAGWISHPRVSPGGHLVAFIDHPVAGDDAGSVAVVDLKGQARTLAGNWSSVQGLAWAPEGEEVWFTATESGTGRALRAVTLQGTHRLVTRETGQLTLLDIAKGGRILMSRETSRTGINALAPGESRERDLSWLDWSILTDLSPDGRQIVIDEQGEGAGRNYSVYLRKTDGSVPIRLGEGNGDALSPDGKWVYSRSTMGREALLLPTGAGEPKRVSLPGLVSHVNVRWLPDGERIICNGVEEGRAARVYVINLSDGKRRPVTPEGVSVSGSGFRPVSEDGRWLAAFDLDRKAQLYPVEGGEPRPLPGLAWGEQPIRFSADGRWLYAFKRGEIPIRAFRLEVASGRREHWRDLAPSDLTGLVLINRVFMTPDAKAYAYNFRRLISELYMAEGFR